MKRQPTATALTFDMFDLELDARRFYARMALDIGALTAGADRSFESAAKIARTLLEALRAGPVAKTTVWDRLYRDITVLTAGYPLETVPENLKVDALLALGRMRQFLAENADIAGSELAIFRTRVSHDAGGAA